MLEATVARLESALFQLQSSSISGPPPIPPRELPPSPRRSARLDDAIPHALFQANAPQPLQHSPPLSSRSSHRPNQSHTPLLAHQANTPRPPNHPPPLASPAQPPHQSHTPQPPNHPAPTLSSSSRSHSAIGRLPSSVIDKSSLASVSSVIQNNAGLVGKDGKIRTMALVLAREAYFGESVLAQCTPQGYADKSGLPLDELMALKEELRKLYPNYWNNPLAFEERWSKCLETISQACNRMRAKQQGVN